MSQIAVLSAREDGYARKRWSVAEFCALQDLHLLEPDCCELQDGDIVCTKRKEGNRPVLSPLEDDCDFKKWRVADCQVMLDSGLFDLNKYELLQGELVSKMAQGRPHIAVITVIYRVLAALFDALAIQNQGPIGIGQIDPNNDPEPDFAVLRGNVFDYIDHPPNPATDVLLAVEVSDSTLRLDMNAKASLYAQNGLREYWIVAIMRRQLIVHRSPTAQGYMDVQTYSETDSVSPLAAPHATVRVADLLPPQSNAS